MEDIEDIQFSSKLNELNKSTIYYHNHKVAESYNIPKFTKEDLGDIKNFSMTITSKRRTGKSVFLRDLCHKIKDWYSDCYLFSLTADLQPEIYSFIPEKNRFSSFNEEDLAKIYEGCVEYKKKNKDKDPKYTMVIFDDMIGEKDCIKSPCLKKIFVNGRHCNMATIFITQTITGIPPVLRKNVDFAVSFFLENEDDRKLYSKSYLSTENSRIGMILYDRITKEPYQSIVVLNYKIGNDPEKYVRKYVANTKIPDYVIGEKDIKKLYIKSEPEFKTKKVTKNNLFINFI